MPRTIKGKITVGIVSISIIVLVVINLIIWGIFERNLQTFIINDMEKIRDIVFSEIKRQYPMSNGKNNLSNKNEIWSVLNTVSNQYNTYLSMNYLKNNFRQFAGESLDSERIDNIIIDSNKKSSLLYIHNTKIKFYATYSYPVYIDNDYIGVFVFQKDYLNEYNNYVNLIMKIILIQLNLFILMIFVNYIWLRKITDPLNDLSMAMTFVGEGKFSNKLRYKNNDEIGILIEHFNKMEEQIIEQMRYLQSEKKKIEELEKESRDFFNYATHEMKTPITSILGYTQLLQKGNLDSEVIERAYTRITAESERMYRLIQNMLSVARCRQLEEYEPENFNVKELLSKIIYDFELAFNKQKINICFDCDDAVIFAVKEEIRTIIRNLIDNGIKYSQDGNIIIKCKSEDGVCITIENKILPIPQEIRENLLEPFIKYNYEEYTQTSSGLGLFICKELAEKNNAYMDYEVYEDKICFMVKFVKI
ncbi:HAMP domain-containing sensor histidine kinase [Tissierella praeacuta]|uniref:HAMP domain-containing sensor histidine kinase n=1 Tax=Tissierella praeacuta TaxID=43131 RepID=UPI001C10279B|nr:HAMP domain-containing sensor histidine kinase [Tissierella praeacuta]MBU5255113.1 HAMP domain-containing histidine kinase [Tissierella praeacuta]